MNHGECAEKIMNVVAKGLGYDLSYCFPSIKEKIKSDSLDILYDFSDGYEEVIEDLRTRILDISNSLASGIHSVTRGRT